MTRIGVLLGFALLLSGCGDIQSLFRTPVAAPSSAPSPKPTPVIIVAGTPPPAASKCQSRLMGRVIDAAGKVIKNATVDLSGANVNAKTISDSNGLYGFAGLCAGSYHATVTVPGRAAQPIAQPVTTDGADTIKLDLSAK